MTSSATLILIVFFVMLLVKVPVPFAVAGAAIVGLTKAHIGLQLITSSPFNSLNSFTLLAVPFFILAGNFMSTGAMANKMLRVAQVFFGKNKSGIAITTIVASAFFAALSGSAVATLACIGSLTIPMMVKEGYKLPYATAIAASGAIVGPIIPPSVIMCVYGVQTGCSISDLFIGGLIPGLLMSIGFVLVIKLTMKKNVDMTISAEGAQDKYTVQDKLRAVWEGKWALLMPVIVLGGIYGGIFTPTESAVVACDYALIISLFVEKDITLKDIYNCFRGTVAVMGGLMILLGMAAVFGQVLVLNKIPQMVTNGVLSLTGGNHILILLAINAVLLVAGCFMEAGACIVIFTPLMLPLVQKCGITVTEFGVIMCANLVIGTLTPPFGTNLFMGSSLTGEPVFRIAKYCIPFMLSSLAVVLLCTFVPSICSFLPNLLAG